MAEVKASVTLEDIQKIAQQIVERFNPQRVILFGSYAYGTPTEESDLDFCVVMDVGDEPPFQAALRLRKAIDPPVWMGIGHPKRISVDIHIMSPSEFEASLLRKGVFVTVIATKGIILYEAPDATPLETLLAHQGEWRGDGMKPETQDWVNKAESDWVAAQWMGQAPTSLWDNICFAAQQCAEKYLKAFLEEHGILFQKTHKLDELLNQSGGQLPELEPLRSQLDWLSYFGIAVRYPGIQANQQTAEQALQIAEQVRSVVRAKLGLP